MSRRPGGALLLLAAAVVAVLAWTAPGPTPRPSAPAPDTARPTVVLLHGLGRTEFSMKPMARALEEAGYRVVNLGYPSRRQTIPELVETVEAELEACCASEPLRFVTHSLGGILVRAYSELHGPGRVGRVVMLSPPNQGSRVVDEIPDELLRLVLGPAALQLGTDSASVPIRLPPVSFELGIITGDASLNPLFSRWLPGEDDGKVSVESAYVEGAEDFLVVPYSHTFIMRQDEVIAQTIAFLETGSFLHER
ncbi:MAG: alpha/beta hydrolase [Gemmatimonadota bacterium]